MHKILILIAALTGCATTATKQDSESVVERFAALQKERDEAIKDAARHQQAATRFAEQLASGSSATVPTSPLAPLAPVAPMMPPQTPNVGIMPAMYFGPPQTTPVHTGYPSNRYFNELPSDQFEVERYGSGNRAFDGPMAVFIGNLNPPFTTGNMPPVPVGPNPCAQIGQHQVRMANGSMTCVFLGGDVWGHSQNDSIRIKFAIRDAPEQVDITYVIFAQRDLSEPPSEICRHVIHYGTNRKRVFTPSLVCPRARN